MKLGYKQKAPQSQREKELTYLLSLALSPDLILIWEKI